MKIEPCDYLDHVLRFRFLYLNNLREAFLKSKQNTSSAIEKAPQATASIAPTPLRTLLTIHSKSITMASSTNLDSSPQTIMCCSGIDMLMVHEGEYDDFPDEEFDKFVLLVKMALRGDKPRKDSDGDAPISPSTHPFVIELFEYQKGPDDFFIEPCLLQEPSEGCQESRWFALRDDGGPFMEISGHRVFSGHKDMGENGWVRRLRTDYAGIEYACDAHQDRRFVAYLWKWVLLDPEFRSLQVCNKIY